MTMVLSKEQNLDALLRYDRYARHAFRTYVFPADKQWKDFEYLRLEENATLAQGLWKLAPTEARNGSVGLQTEHSMSGWKTARCNWRPRRHSRRKSPAAHGKSSAGRRSRLTSPCTTGLALGLELVFNLLAPDAPDRYLLANEVRRQLDFRGEIVRAELVVGG